MVFPPKPRGHTVAQIIAETMCECDGKDWLAIVPYERDRYARIAILAEDRIRMTLLAGAPGPETTEALLSARRDRPGTG
jgi:hypothetical protein